MRDEVRLWGNFGTVACIEFVSPWYFNPRGVLFLGSTAYSCTTCTCIGSKKRCALSRGCYRLL